MNKGEMNKDCKLCGYPFTPTLHPINRLANSKGYCSWICLTGDLGDEAANEIIKKLKK